jgi:formylmethanofuran:tetrahydromethanopterin formyltransferase
VNALRKIGSVTPGFHGRVMGFARKTMGHKYHTMHPNYAKEAIPFLKDIEKSQGIAASTASTMDPSQSVVLGNPS